MWACSDSLAKSPFSSPTLSQAEMITIQENRSGEVVIPLGEAADGRGKGVGGPPLVATHFARKNPALLRGLSGERLLLVRSILSCAHHLRAFLADRNAVSVAFENFLRNPCDDCGRVLDSLELLCKLRFELFDIRHVHFVVGW